MNDLYVEMLTNLNTIGENSTCIITHWFMLHDASEAKRLVGLGSLVCAGVRTGISSKKMSAGDGKWRKEQEARRRGTRTGTRKQDRKQKDASKCVCAVETTEKEMCVGRLKREG